MVAGSFCRAGMRSFVDAVRMRLLWLSIICFVLFMQL